MANLTAKFQMVDEMSAKLDEVGRSGERMVDRLDQISDAAESAFGEVQSGSAQAAQSVDGVATAATSATQKATEMGDEIAEAARKATEETEKLGEETDKLGDKSKDTGEKGKGAFEEISEAIAAAGITAMVGEAAEAVYELADAFSEAEKSIIGTTGATGAELEALMDSAKTVFSSSNAESLEQVASSMSSVKKATGLIGDELENATGYALAFEDVLGFEVSQSAKTASALMKNFGITAEDAYAIIAYGAQNGADKNGDLLDILNEYSAHYAALGLSADEFLSSLIEGAEAGVFSVDKVGDAVKEFNIRAKDGSESTAEAFEMLGMNADVMSAKFAAGGETASESFFAVVSALNAMDDPMAKNTAAVALFGTMYEDLEASILPVLDNIEGSTFEMHNALNTVTTDAKSLSDKWTEAGNSLESAFSKAVSPAITGVSESLAAFTKGMGDYLQKHPAVAKAITAVGVGIGVAAAAIAGYVAITKVAIPLVLSFNTAMSANPIGAVAVAVTAVVSALVAFVAMMETAEDETSQMSETTRAQYLELRELEAAYEDACDTYGETSEEASRLRYQVDELSDAFESNRQTFGEFAEECQNVIDAHAEMVDRFDESRDAIDASETSTLALIQKLSDLADGTYQTADSQSAMQAIIDELNGSIEGLNLSYSDVINNQATVIQGIREMAQAEAERARQQQMYDEYVELIQLQATTEEQLAIATDEVTAAQGRFAAANSNYQSDLSKWGDYGSIAALFTGSAGEWDTAKKRLDDATSYQAGLQATLDDTEARIAAIEAAWDQSMDTMEDATDVTEDLEDSTVSWIDASCEAFDAIQSEMEELIQEYNDVYDAALESFEGQFGLFDKASTESEEYLNATVSNAQAALDSQLLYWHNYSANLETLQGITADQLGITQENYEALMSYVQDGSAEAAGLAANIVDNLNSGNDEAVAVLATTLGSVISKREEIATSTAEWTTDFNSRMDELTTKMEETIDGLDLSDSAAGVAKSTILAYADAILQNRDSAVDAATQVADAVNAALLTHHLFGEQKYKPHMTYSISGYAGGTTNSDGVFIAGEEGPELILDHEGASVFPTSETDRIVRAVTSMDSTSDSILTLPKYKQEPASNTQSPSSQEKIVRIEIAGSGSIGVRTGTNKEDVVELMYANLRPVLLSIVQEEMFEEGDNSYDF